MKKLKVMLVAAAILFILILAFMAGFLVYSSAVAYSPPETENLAVTEKEIPGTIPAGQLSLCTWNIGYAGLGKEMDFFYEGGRRVRPAENEYRQYRDGIAYALSTLSGTDIILLQEVDTCSRRSYSDNQFDRLKAALNSHCASFALNYKVPFVPVPLKSPMGKVTSGLMLLSGYKPLEVTRYSFPSGYGWPKKLFMLSRCFILARYAVGNGRQLVVINTHNSAFSDAAEMRAQELDMLKKVMIKEADADNYVIVGGDWNQNPVPFETSEVTDGNVADPITPPIPADWLPAGWQWAFDPSKSTNRAVNAPYKKGVSSTTLIDFFVASPNVSLISAATLGGGFSFSDHQPVGLRVELK